MDDLEKYYSITDAYKMFGLHYQTIVRMILRGELGAVKLAGKWKIPQSEMDRIRELCDVRKK